MIIKTFSVLLLLNSVTPSFAETAQDQYISYIVAEEAKDRFAFNESVTVNMFQQWVALGDNSKEFDVDERVESLIDKNTEADVVCNTVPTSQEMLFCYMELSNVTYSLLGARMKWLEGQGYEVQSFYDAHETYSELMCTGLVDLDYGDIGNTYSHISYLGCSLDYMKSFMSFLSSFHGASFK